MVNCMAVKAKRNQKSSQNPRSKRSPQWPCSLNLLRDWQNKGPPLAELYEMSSKARGTTSTLCTDRAVWADFAKVLHTGCFAELPFFLQWPMLNKHLSPPGQMNKSKAEDTKSLTHVQALFGAPHTAQNARNKSDRVQSFNFLTDRFRPDRWW